jgi:arylsulfatase A-like enzyme
MLFCRKVSLCLTLGCLCVGTGLSGCGFKPTASQDTAAAKRENTRVERHVLPESWRFDLILDNARTNVGAVPDESKPAYRISFQNGTPAWAFSGDTSTCAVVNNTLVFETKTGGACDSPVGNPLPSKDAQFVIMRVKASGCEEFTFAWRGDEDQEFDPAYASRIRVARPDAWVTYRLETRGLSAWRTTKEGLLQLRFGISGSGRLEIDYIELLPTMDMFAGKACGSLRYAVKRRLSRQALFARTPCTLDFDVTVMEKARLTTGLAIPERSPTRFRIAVADASGKEVLLDNLVRQANTWEDVSLDLSSSAGKRVTISFEAESERPGAIALWSSPTLARHYSVTESERPINVIWYVIDALRPDCLSAYGYERQTSATIDQVAAEGVRFERCFSPGTWTVDSVTSMFTGLSPIAHSVPELHPKPHEKMLFLPEVLRAAGYVTGQISQNPYVSEQRGLNRGFDEAGRYRVRDPRSSKKLTAQTYAPNRAVFRFLEKHTETPFFLYVHTLETHHPYLPPRSLLAFTQPDGSMRTADLYDDCVLWADIDLTVVADKMKELGLWNNTLLIVTADHGEGLMEKDGVVGHGHEPFLCRVHIPLIMRLPGILPEGLVIKENVQTLDILPTLLELLGIPAVDQFGGDSLVGLIRGSEKEKLAQRTIFPCGDFPKWQAVVKGNWFFHDNDGKYELFDIETIPRQPVNVSEEHPDVVQAMLEEARRFQEVERAKGDLYPTDSEPTETIDKEDIEELKALGYLE